MGWKEVNGEDPSLVKDLAYGREETAKVWGCY